MTASRTILHVDMDAFFASIEQLDDPALRGRPVLVGGDGPRGVVAAASYEARPFGCRSAQPMSVALRQCPQAVVVPPRGRRYREVSREVFAIFERFTPLVEPLSVDEAFLDVTGSHRLHGTGPEIAGRIRAAVRAETGLTCSVGVARSKFLAKLASDLDKPDGLVIVDPDTVESFLAPMPIRRMWGVGKATEARLDAMGIRTFGDVTRHTPEALREQLGVWGPRLHELARGIDERPVVCTHGAKSISHEHTYGEDVADPEAVRTMILQHAEHVARRLRAHEVKARTVTVKIRYGDFETITRSHTLGEATDRTDILWTAARDLFDEWARRSFSPVRLIGVGASHLATGEGQGHLFDDGADERMGQLDRATDVIQERFGGGAIRRGV